MAENWKARVQDMLNAIASIQLRTAGITYDSFESNETVAKATLYDFLIISAAARTIPAEIKSEYTDISWQMLNDMRTVIAYDYKTNLERVWRTSQSEFPLLLPKLQNMLQHEWEREAS